LTTRGTEERAHLLPLFVMAFLFLAFLGALAVPVHAADDSNSGQLTPVPNVDPKQLNSALSTLAQGSNDTQLQQLLAQFQSEMAAGNYTAASSTLVDLQALSAQSGNTQSLNALLQSLSIGSQGATVNANTLQSLLNAKSSGESSQRLSVDLQSLAGLMQYANSTLATQLLESSNALSRSSFENSSGISAAAPVAVALPGVSGFSKLGVPSIGAPSVSVGTPGGIPSVPIIAFVLPVMLAAVGAGLYFSRGRLGVLVGSTSLPAIPFFRRTNEERTSAFEETPRDPRSRIEFYFRKATRLMSRRGFPKLDSETHREFSAKCDTAPGGGHVRAISTLYEKAKFSGREVGDPDADLAASELKAIGKEER
jgi:hypothetical protein